MPIIIRSVLCALVLLTLTGTSETCAQERSSTEGWQGPRPTPQQGTVAPGSQRPVSPGRQVLEIPSQSQGTLAPPRQQAEIPSRPQTEISPRPQVGLPSRSQREVHPSQLVTVTVTDAQGRYVGGLQREDFVLYEDNEPQDITYFNTGENEPVSLGLIVDVSGSMVSKIDRARFALRRLIDTIRPQDEVFVEAFNQQPFLLQDFTDSRLLLTQAISALRAVGGTALYDAILDGLHRVKHGRHQKKALVVLSDGQDHHSLSTLNQVVSAARRSGVLIYAIGIGSMSGGFSSGVTPQIAIGPFIFGGGGGGGFDEPIDSRTLQEVSDQTGGRLFIMSTNDVLGNANVLETATRAIFQELRSQYSLGYTPSRSGSHYRSVRVETRRGDADRLVVRAQKGYVTEPQEQVTGSSR